MCYKFSMNRFKIVGLLAFVCLFAVCRASIASAQEESSPFYAEISLELLSDYMWRGIQQYDGTSVQPEVVLAYDTAYGSLSGELFGHISAENSGPDDSIFNRDNFLELDPTIAYELEFELIRARAGATWFFFFDSAFFNDTAEFFLTVELDVLLSPSISAFHDYREREGQFYELSLSEPVPIDWFPNIEIAPYLLLGFSSNVEIYQDDGLNHITYGLQIAPDIGPLQLGISANYTSSIDNSVEDEFWFAASIIQVF